MPLRCVHKRRDETVNATKDGLCADLMCVQLQLITIGASPGSFAKGSSATGTIDPGLASSLTNGL